MGRVGLSSGVVNLSRVVKGMVWGLVYGEAFGGKSWDIGFE